MKTVWTFLAFLAFRALAVSAATYGYSIFYEKASAACANSAVNIHPWVSGEEFDLYGASSSDQMCSTESLCAVNPESEQCKSLVPGSEFTVNITVLPNGTELLCRNTTNCVVSPRCSASAGFPNCSLSSVSQAVLLGDPTVIKNTQFPASAINQTSYLVYYTDSQCSQVAGLSGFVSGNNSGVNVTTTTNASGVSCSDAMACMINSAGPSCQLIGSKGTSEITSFVSADGSVVKACVNGDCNDRLPSACLSSGSYFGCYFRRLSGKVLFENPSQYLTPPSPAPGAGPTPARPTSSALQKTHRILGAGLAVLQALLF